MPLCYVLNHNNLSCNLSPRGKKINTLGRPKVAQSEGGHKITITKAEEAMGDPIETEKMGT